MATQPHQRAKMKHQMATAPRQQPRLVNRTDNHLLRDMKSGYGPEGRRREFMAWTWAKVEKWWR